MDVQARARKNHSVILQHLADTKLGPVAEAVGVHESTISRMKNEDLEKVSKLLAACGLKVVPVQHECHSPEYIAALRELARAELERQIAEMKAAQVARLGGRRP